MKLNIEDVLNERNKIVHSFCVPLQQSRLIPTDITDHRSQVEKVYKGMLHEACVIDDCCRRFEKTFEERRFMIIG